MNIVYKISVVHIFKKQNYDIDLDDFTITSVTYYLHFRKSGCENVR